ncbi:conserved hypothetical protein [Rhodopseudomonas palustris BisB5]|uniref:DUF429 domain-containing protein n=1 Tax=Rhodopseudomonas palustris (strain BisB5) TaxID=316057 RepID=Q13F88_RHOPS|nr:conserved hypothetical protein [Rhodopseudomonas palustris BisB5]
MKATFIGFDSAWTDNPKRPGAICSIDYDGSEFSEFRGPTLVGFKQALEFIQSAYDANRLTLVAVDQPTIVNNLTGMRAAERVAAAAVSWLGGGVQPASRSRSGMFDDNAPIWKFLRELGACDDPERCKASRDGLFIMEVFPALALPAFHPGFCGRLSAPRYNPARSKTFRQSDWEKVTKVVGEQVDAMQCPSFNDWCASLSSVPKPKKSDQDKLDASICLLIALHWMVQPRESSVMIGDLTSGYIVAPVVDEIRRRLTDKARSEYVAIDGKIPG